MMHFLNEIARPCLPILRVTAWVPLVLFALLRWGPSRTLLRAILLPMVLVYPSRTLLRIILLPMVLVYLGTAAIPVYDCQDNRATKLALDLREAAPCPDPETDYDPPTTVHVQLLAADTDFPISAIRCRVRRTKEVHRCGYDSIHYGYTYSEYEAPVDVTPGECREAMATGLI